MACDHTISKGGSAIQWPWHGWGRVGEREGAELSDASNSNGGGKETVIAECPSENGNSEGGAERGEQNSLLLPHRIGHVNVILNHRGLKHEIQPEGRNKAS